jgi:hypothetical protein
MSLFDDLKSVHYEDVGSSKGAAPGVSCVVTFESTVTRTISYGARFWFQDVDGIVADDQIESQENVAIGPGAPGLLVSRPELVQKVYYLYTTNDNPPQKISGTVQAIGTSSLGSFTVPTG